MASPEVDDGPTEVQARTALRLHSRRAVATVEWSDADGPHSVPLETRALVGSSAEVPVRVRDRAVSRLHAELELKDDGVWVRDLGSRNGTWIEGTLVHHARVPPTNGRLRLGDTNLNITFRADGADVPLWPTERFGALLGGSDTMRALFLRLSQYAQSDAPVLIQGETGTGKELAAEAIHEASRRGAGPFAVVDCGALPEALLESELFGHVRGAFTGAIANRAGAFESAHGGTVFLDEIGELPLTMQPKLLRVLETQTVRRVGESEYRKVDVRFIAATHRDLQSMVGAGAFREDLFFRLNVLPAHMPPLRERADDVAVLLAHFLSRAPQVALDQTMLDALRAHPWLGNVRELRSFAERVLAVGVEQAWNMMRGVDVPTRFPPPPGSARMPPPSMPTSAAGALPPVATDIPFKVLREQWLDHLEREYIGAFSRKGMNAPAIAEVAGLDRSYVLRLMRKHNL